MDGAASKHDGLGDMVSADYGITIERRTDFSVGLELWTGQEHLDLTGWAFTGDLLTSAGAAIRALNVAQTDVDCVVFSLNPTETEALTAQQGFWEVWGVREDGYKFRFIKGRLTII